MTGKTRKKPKQVATIKHDEASRKNLPTAELEAVMEDETKAPIQVAYERRNRDLDPQLVWRGKYEQNQQDLIAQAPPLFIQEKVNPKYLIDDMLKHTESARPEPDQLEMFADFNGLPEGATATDFYQHDANWSNRMILGDSLQVMSSLAEREGLRGKVQCIYIDPPYGIKFNSNFQWSTTSRDVKDGKAEHITREPEQVKAFRDTWRDGIHSYLSYLRDRLTVARELLTESGSVFVQIGDENVHRVRGVMDEVFGSENYIATVSFSTTGGLPAAQLSRVGDYLLVFALDARSVKWRHLKEPKRGLGEQGSAYNRVQKANLERRSATAEEKTDPTKLAAGARVFSADNLNGQGPPPERTPFVFEDKEFEPAANSHWKPNYPAGMIRLARSYRIERIGSSLRYVRLFDDNPFSPITNTWLDTGKAGFASNKTYVVETNESVVQRCILMATDPGDLVLDPTCGSGTTATVAEQWGRRWITIDTSRVALALARARIMGARYPYYLLADSKDGQRKEGEITGRSPSDQPTAGDIRKGFVYGRVPHITLKSIANNAEIDVIWERWQETLEPLREQLNATSGNSWEEWEIPRDADEAWSDKTKDVHGKWWEARIARQAEIDDSIARNADHELLYDRPYEDKSKVRVAGPFTVESVSPHRTLVVGADDELIDPQQQMSAEDTGGQSFATMVLENLSTAGVQQASKGDRIEFNSITPWPGIDICAEGRYMEGGEDGTEKRAAIFVGPEFGTVGRNTIARIAREAAEAGFDVLVTCAFGYDGMSTDLDRVGKVKILKARMNADLHMGGELKNTGKGNLFVVFGEPDIELRPAQSDGAEPGQFEVKLNGVDVFDPSTGEIRSDDTEGIACWFIDTDYNDESFFVRHAYFLGANDPYKSLKTTLKAEIDQDAWATLNSDVSRPFDTPETGRIAVKVINHLGDEVMKVLSVG